MPLTYTNTLVIMGRDKESSLAVMREEVDDLLTRVHSLEYQRDELKKDHDKIEKELENSKSHIKRQEELFESKCKKISDQEHRIAQHLETINRLETDIGKLRDEFGGAAIRAVLED
jgi:chromosome segregation ATPase